MLLFLHMDALHSWRDMPKVEQDKFIERAEALA